METTATDNLDRVEPGEKWAFDAAVTDVFDDMLRRSIPQYEVMRKAVFDIGERFVTPNTDIVDLGSSRGEAIEPFVKRFESTNRIVAVEISDPMLDVLRSRFASQSNVIVSKMDLRKQFPICKASVILSILTIQFTPIEYRHQIIQDIYNNLVPGGAFLFVEKLLGNTSEINLAMVNTYHELKKENGYEKESIERKKASLEGVLVPVTSKWNAELLESAGFRAIDCFWRWMNFAGFIAIKQK